MISFPGPEVIDFRNGPEELDLSKLELAESYERSDGRMDQMSVTFFLLFS